MAYCSYSSSKSRTKKCQNNVMVQAVGRRMDRKDTFMVTSFVEMAVTGTTHRQKEMHETSHVEETSEVDARLGDVKVSNPTYMFAKPACRSRMSTAIILLARQRLPDCLCKESYGTGSSGGAIQASFYPLIHAKL
ncbi:hypothetical protein BT69DRAFT_1275628 [Atractiella rhizophila]|nr:hypothetical protein BT69DRAFT_1275628 [Atractiella rhizophila]